jgi:hypothetical protein
MVVGLKAMGSPCDYGYDVENELRGGSDSERYVSNPMSEETVRR